MIGWKTPFVSSLVVLAACASGGPGVEGPAAQALFNRWNGTWSLDTESSEDPAEALSDLASSSGNVPQQGQAVGRGGGGKGGGGGRGGGRGGRGGGGRGGDTAPPQRSVSRAGFGLLLTLGRQVPQTLAFQLTDSLFVLATTPGSRISLPMDGEKLELANQSAMVEAKVSWNEQIPTVEREVEGAGGIKDRFELLAADRLLLTRRVSVGPESASIRLVFDRSQP